MKKATNQDKVFADIVKAMRLRRPVTMTYTRANGTTTVRTVEPYRLTKNGSGDPYFRAMDRESGESRSFRLDRIQTYTIGGHKSRFLLETPEPKPAAETPSKAEMKRAAEYAKADRMERPTPLTVARRLPVRRVPARPIHVAHLSALAVNGGVR